MLAEQPKEREEALVGHDSGPRVSDVAMTCSPRAVTTTVRNLSSKEAAVAAVREANSKLRAAEVILEAAESAATTARRVAYRHRVELGCALIEARKLWPASGPKANGWAELLKSEGLPRQTALNYMKLAGLVEEDPTPRRENLSYRKLGIKRDKKPPSLSEHLTSVLADLEGRLIEATEEERQALVSVLEKWLGAYR